MRAIWVGTNEDRPLKSEYMSRLPAHYENTDSNTTTGRSSSTVGSQTEVVVSWNMSIVYVNLLTTYQVFGLCGQRSNNMYDTRGAAAIWEAAQTVPWRIPNAGYGPVPHGNPSTGDAKAESSPMVRLYIAGVYGPVGFVLEREHRGA